MSSADLYSTICNVGSSVRCLECSVLEVYVVGQKEFDGFADSYNT